MMPWEEYVQRSTQEWAGLLESKQGKEERSIQSFLVRHPSFVPGAYSLIGPSGHRPFPGALISQPPLSGVGNRIPDFMWLSMDSANFSPVLIEIESPVKRWFNSKGDPTQDLVHALNQIGQWRAWLNRPENVRVFFEHYRVPEWCSRELYFRPEFCLIYGRRSEFERRPELTRLRAQFERNDQVVMTYDRLAPSQGPDKYICVSKTGERYRALSVPARFSIGPNAPSDWAQVQGLDDAILGSEWISEERRRFLVDRLPYWMDWLARDSHGIINSGDWE